MMPLNKEVLFLLSYIWEKKMDNQYFLRGNKCGKYDVPRIKY